MFCSFYEFYEFRYIPTPSSKTLFHLRPHQRNWFKGNDTRTICSFVQWKFGTFLADYEGNSEDYLRNIWATAKFANDCLRALYSNGLWMQADTARSIASDGFGFLRLFNKLAAHALACNLPRYQVIPKSHMWAHVVHSLRAEAGCSQLVLNPLSFSCQQDEDFVGRICALARVCHPATLHFRTLQKYKVAVATRWGQ